MLVIDLSAHVQYLELSCVDHGIYFLVGFGSRGRPSNSYVN